MIELSISGTSDGFVASSNIDMFAACDQGTITNLLMSRLRNSQEIELPFDVLSIFVLAKSHDAPNKPNRKANNIGIRSHKALMGFKTGQLMKAFDLLLDNDNFYTLATPEKHKAIALAFEGLASRIAKEFAGESGAALAAQIRCAAKDYLSQKLAA